MAERKECKKKRQHKSSDACLTINEKYPLYFLSLRSLAVSEIGLCLPLLLDILCNCARARAATPCGGKSGGRVTQAYNKVT